MIVVYPLLDKILDISDAMLDTVIAICQSHLDSTKERDHIEFETRFNVISDEESSWKVNFHVFVPTELGHHLENCDVGVTGEFNEWNPDRISILSSKKKLLNDGWLMTGQVTFPLDTDEIQYKYILKDRTTNQIIWELLPNEREGNRILNLSGHLNSKEFVCFFYVKL